MRWIKEIGFAFVALTLLFTILQTDQLFHFIQTIFLFKIFVLVSILVIVLWLIMTIRDYLRQRGIFYYCVNTFSSLSISRSAKYIIVIVLLGNFIAIGLGKQRYPFYDVGMYRWPKEYRTRDKTVYEVKYYYRQAGEYKILELRKESSLLLAEHFGLGYSNDIAYATTYFHKGEKENFEYLSREMQERGVDTLWAGVHSFNFDTHEVTFDPDICNAISINQTAKLYYGPLYIPTYQIEKCDGL
ncbi:MAG TPA: hypothetical protein PLR30_16220 [Saprospiraceae bacterium]|nr:hypothetical protein [Saprospiraceae bacterium]